jgi:hypothetical protein
MKTVKILLFIMLFFGIFKLINSMNINGNISNDDKPQYLNESDEMWRLDRIARFKYNEELSWHPKGLTTFQYRSDSIFEGTVVYNDYSLETKKYSTRTEHREGDGLDSVINIDPLQDSNFNNWSKNKGTIFLTNSTENRVEEYQFRYKAESNKWFLYNLMIDSFDNKLKVQRYFYSDIDPGNYPIQESKVLYRYADTLLLEISTMWRKGEENLKWQYSKRENFTYEGDLLQEREVFYFFDKENKWNLTEKEELNYEENNQTKTFFEYDNRNPAKTGYKIVEKKDKVGNLVEKIHFNWNDRKKAFEHFYTENTKLKDNLVLEIIESYSDPNYYDKYVAINRYDSFGRLIETEKKHKNDEDKNWKFLSKDSFGFYKENEVPATVRRMNSKGIISEEIKIEFDDLQNPIKRISMSSGREYELEIKHDYSIDSNNILTSEKLKILETNIEKKVWKHNMAPVQRIYYRIVNGAKVKYNKVDYIYKKIK